MAKPLTPLHSAPLPSITEEKNLSDSQATLDVRASQTSDDLSHMDPHSTSCEPPRDTPPQTMTPGNAASTSVPHARPASFDGFNSSTLYVGSNTSLSNLASAHSDVSDSQATLDVRASQPSDDLSHMDPHSASCEPPRDTSPQTTTPGNAAFNNGPNTTSLTSLPPASSHTSADPLGAGSVPSLTNFSIATPSTPPCSATTPGPPICPTDPASYVAPQLQQLDSSSSASLTSASRDLLQAAWSNTAGRLFRRSAASSTAPTNDMGKNDNHEHNQTPAPNDDEGRRQQHTPQRVPEPLSSPRTPAGTADGPPTTPVACASPEPEQHTTAATAAAQVGKPRITWDKEEVVTLRAAPGSSPSSPPTTWDPRVQPPSSPAARATRIHRQGTTTHSGRPSTPARGQWPPRGGSGDNSNHRGDTPDDSSADSSDGEFASATSSGTLTSRF